MAEKVWEVIIANGKTRATCLRKLMAQICGATDEATATGLIQVADRCGDIEKPLIENLRENIQKNNVIMSSRALAAANALLQKYGLAPISKAPAKRQQDINADDLPF